MHFREFVLVFWHSVLYLYSSFWTFSCACDIYWTLVKIRVQHELLVSAALQPCTHTVVLVLEYQDFEGENWGQ